MLTKEVKLDPRVKRTRQLLQNSLVELLTKKEYLLSERNLRQFQPQHQLGE